MSDWHNDLSDDELLAHLQAAFDARVPIPDSMVELIMAGYDITNIDSYSAQLIEDARLETATGVRSASDGPRMLTFQHEDHTFEFEIGAGTPRLVIGHIEPPGPGSMHFEQADRMESVELGGMGQFEFTLHTTGPFRLRFQPSAGTGIATDWILP